MDLPDIWMTCQEFYDVSQGDSEEHALLLANLFQFEDNKAHPSSDTSVNQ